MIKLIYFVILSVCFVCVLKNNKSKLITILAAIGTFIIFAGNNSNSDYNLYLFSFMMDDYERYEIGYKLYYEFYKKVGINNYQTTLIITFIVLGIIIYLMAKKITDNYIEIIFFLLISELFIDTVQIRILIASVFLFAAIVIYPIEKRKAFLLILISTSFQMVSLFYIPFFLIGMFKKKEANLNSENLLRNKNKYNLVFICLIVYMSLLIFNNVFNINFPLMIIGWLGHKWSVFEHVTYYFNGTAWGSIQFVILYLSNLLTIWYLRTNSKQIDSKYADIILNINIYAAFSIPFLFVDMNFYRLFRILNLANFVYYAMVLDYNRKNCITIKNLKMVGFVCLFQLTWFFSYLIRVPEIYNDIFKYNMWG